MSEKVFLSRRNLLTLLSKLDRNKAEPGASQYTLIKCDNQHKTHAQTMPEIVVTAVEDDIYYAEREGGMIHPEDDPRNVPNR